MKKQNTDCQFDEDLPKNLIKLKALTEVLDFGAVVRKSDTPEIKEFEVDHGTSYMVGLYKANDLAVARVYSSAGCKFPPHQHDEWELIIVYQGEIHLNFDDKVIKLKEKEFYYVEPGIKHGAFYPVDSWVLCVTMPASPDFPSGG